MVKLLVMVKTHQRKWKWTEAALPLSLSLVMGARGPEGVTMDGRLTKKRGQTGMGSLIAHSLDNFTSEPQHCYKLPL